MTSPQLSPPGSAHYSSNTMDVGDGTWDASRNDFLLPNIQGLNFDTMRYNGMGNRFRGLPEYSTIIIAHGTIATITFLFLVPAAILIASFYHRNPRLALRLHISLQTITVILATIVFVLGYFAVGPARSLTNPHHGIGVAIYVLVLFQALFGWLVHKIEKGKMRYHIPIKLMLHQWIGRATALLALAQIPIGLTLYGSPEWLFVVYALVMAAYVLLYFVLTYENHRRVSGAYDDVSQTDGTNVSQRRQGFGWGTLAGVAAGGAGLAALSRRLSGRHRDGTRVGATESAISSRPESGDSYYDEKYANDGQHQSDRFRNRILEGAAGIGGVAALRSWYDRKRGKETTSEVDTYRPPLGGAVNPSQSGVGSSTVHINRIEEGYGPPPGPNNPYGQSYQPSDRWQEIEQREAAQAAETGGGPRHDVRFATQSELHGTEQSYDSRDDGRGRGVLGGLAGLGAGFGIGEWWRRRRDKKDQIRIDEQRRHEEESQHIFGESNTPGRYTGDGTPRRNGRSSPTGFQTGSPQANRVSTFRGPMDRINNTDQLPPPRPFDLHPPPQNIPMPNVLPPPGPTFTGPPPPAHQNRASNELQQRQPPYNNNITNTISNNMNAPVPIPIPPPGQAAAATLPPPPPPSGMLATANRTMSGGSGPGDSPDSRPVSVKVKMHNDGRHVTLRRLNEEEAAAEREARRRDRRRDRRGSISDVSSNPQRYRRDVAATTGAAAPLQPPQPPFAASMRQTPSPMNLSSQPGRVPLAPGTTPSPPGAAAYDTGTGTELSNPLFDENRRRRRAERSRLAAAKKDVEFD